MKITKLFKNFVESEKSAGLLLIFCTVLSIGLSNSYFGQDFIDFWHISLAGNSIEYYLNDGLMTIFFLMIGLELERELYVGELSNFKDALLPIFGAIGGMIFPAAVFLYFNYGTAAQSGAGIPIATDIAFALGILSLIGSKVPLSLKVLLTALAVIDDLGAILIIAIFYTNTIAWSQLIIAFAIFAALLVLNRLKVRNLFPYLIGGFIMWYFMANSGVHATITGVLLAFAIPFGNGDDKSTSYILQEFLHNPVAFFILPLFAFCNSAIVFTDSILTSLTENYSLGIGLGLLIGKPLGIFAAIFFAVSVKICTLPEDVNWKPILGISLLGGIGFTMSIFITLLAFDDDKIINTSKLMIFLASVIAGIIGFLVLKISLSTKHVEVL